MIEILSLLITLALVGCWYSRGKTKRWDDCDKYDRNFEVIGFDFYDEAGVLKPQYRKENAFASILTQASQENEPMNVVIKEQTLDTSRIIEYTGEEPRKFEFRPLTFDQFIGQDDAKEQARTIIKKVARGIKGHLFLSARQGTGKTTFIRLLANELKAKLITRVGRQLDDMEEIINLVNELNTTEQLSLFFLDETDSTNTKSLKALNTIIEQFELGGKKIKPFVFAGASINKDTLIKNNPDLLDRIPHHINFISYTATDISKILSQYSKELYDEYIKGEVVSLISHSSKFCPRIAIGMLEDYIVLHDIQKVMKNRQVIKDGLTNIDIKILETLYNATRPMGANALSMKVGIKEQVYLSEYESFLVEYDYISRTPSRVITPKGVKFLRGLSQ